MSSSTHRRDRRRAVIGASLAGIMALAASPAFAQDSGAQAKDEGEIVVTAQFREQRLQDTPLAITALTGDALEARGQTSLTDLQAPNLKIEQAPGIFGPAAQIYIRGVGQFDSNFTFEPGVGVYIDDVYYATVFGNQFNLLDLERVEVLRGPQGTLAGKNSIGGAIKLYSKKPDGTGDSFVEAQAGSYQLAGVRAAGNITIAPDTVFARISGMSKHVRGYIDRMDYKCTHPSSALPTYVSTGNSCRLGRLGGSNEGGVRGQLRLLPAPGLEINLSADFSHSRGDPAPSVLIQAVAAANPQVNGVSYGPAFQSPNPYTSYALYRGTAASSYQAIAKSELTAWGVSGSISYEASDAIALTSITSYRSADAYFVVDNDESPIPKSESIGMPRQHQFTQELRLNADVGNILDLTLGGFYYDGDALQNGRNLIGSINADFLTADTIKSRSKSAFAHGVVHVTDALNLTGGVRYTDDRKVLTFVRRTADGSFSPSVTPINGQTATFAAKVWDYRAVVDYRWSPGFFTYAQFSTGFKGGGINPRVFFPNQVAPFGVEQLESYEIGFKSDLLDRRVRLNVSAFLNNYKDIQVQTNTPFFNVNLPVQPDPNLPNYNPAGGTAPSAAFLNAGDVRQKGIEVELSANPVEGLQIDGSLSYLKGEYKRLSPQALSSGLTMAMELPFAPRWQGNFGIQYELPFAGGTLTPRLDYQYQSTSYATAVNHPRNRIESRNVFDARLSYRTGDWEAALAVTNLTDDFFYYSKFDIIAAGGYLTGAPSRPREWSISLKRNF
ncbi:TonB-dependent receptor [Sphingomonas canadensis]|uniref:TonB-dependent receptor n=1 Tax=Sphingomonas canadensis TaxID=1219257 RepID=A0ABW3HAX4_9SPHN|nr:TonB-dependent receptor [Sphingomonas canadensis]MCW3838248.1 TonB-dependent receptor [Sphingomonas canadensis]